MRSARESQTRVAIARLAKKAAAVPDAENPETRLPPDMADANQKTVPTRKQRRPSVAGIQLPPHSQAPAKGLQRGRRDADRKLRIARSRRLEYAQEPQDRRHRPACLRKQPAQSRLRDNGSRPQISCSGSYIHRPKSGEE